MQKKKFWICFIVIAGGADADELHSTYEEYITNWHDDLTAYDEEFNNN